MKRYLSSIVILSLAVSGCGQKKAAESSPEDKPDDEPPPTEIVEQRAPTFQAKIFFESQSPDKGTVRFSGSLVAGHKEVTRFGGDSSTQTSSRRWSSESTKMSFTLLDGSVCDINPTFVGHRDGFDEWSLELDYTASGAGGSPPRARVSKTVLFDGESPAEVARDEFHSIILGPAAETNSEPPDASDL